MDTSTLPGHCNHHVIMNYCNNFLYKELDFGPESSTADHNSTFLIGLGRKYLNIIKLTIALN